MYVYNRKNPLGSWLKYLRKQSDRTLRDVSAETGIAVGNLSDLERGKARNPTLTTLRALANCYGVSMSHLVGDTDL